MYRIFACLKLWLLRWTAPLPTVDDASHQTASQGSLKQSARRKSSPRRAEDQLGEFHLKTTILDQLEDYFYYLRRMKKGDPESYELYKRVGAHVVPSLVLNHFGETADHSIVPPYWREHMPSFGCIAFAVGRKLMAYEEKADRINPRFIYFRKYDATGVPSDIQRSNGTTYVMTIYWDDHHDADPNKPKTSRGRGLPTEVPLSVAPDGQVRVLLSRQRQWHNPRGRRDGGFPVVRWGIADFFKQWARENRQGDCARFLIGIFLTAISAHESAANSMTRVAASKDKMTAVFSVGIERTAYFFQERETTLTGTGSKRRIFHIVKAHKRIASGGIERWVRTHFRGEREFMWNGYAVSISVPGWHHKNVAMFDIGAVDEEFAPPGKATVGTEGIGDRLIEVISRGTGGERERRSAA